MSYDYDLVDAAHDAWDDQLRKQGLPPNLFEGWCSGCNAWTPLKYQQEDFGYDGPRGHGIHRYPPRIVTVCCEADPEVCVGETEDEDEGEGD